MRVCQRVVSPKPLCKGSERPNANMHERCQNDFRAIEQVNMEFLDGQLSFLNVTVCAVSFASTESAPHTLKANTPLVFTLPPRVSTWGCV